MTRYTQDDIHRLYERNHGTAIENLCKVEVFCGTRPTLTCVNGWVFEQTVRHCLSHELTVLNLHPVTKEQERIGQRVVIDLLVGTVGIEIKLKGLFGPTDFNRVRKASDQARSQGLSYLCLVGQESHTPYRERAMNAVGRDNAFFLDTPGQWGLFVSRVVELLH